MNIQDNENLSIQSPENVVQCHDDALIDVNEAAHSPLTALSSIVEVRYVFMSSH